jgi:hypothetical protein
MAMRLQLFSVHMSIDMAARAQRTNVGIFGENADL